VTLNRNKLVLAFSLLAGCMDATTGVLLVAAPARTLALFGATLPGGEGAGVLMRWIGVFVAGVGVSYLWAIASSDAAVRAWRLPGVWGATTVIRTGIALFTVAAVATRALDPVWLVVGATDAALAVAQAAALRAGWLQA
jgi:hypothetical protein